MRRLIGSVAVACLLAGLLAGQSTQPTFEIADVHVSPRVSNPSIRVVSTRDGRYELHSATMVDLISRAYGVDVGSVVGGPSWLETDRFDVIAKTPGDGTPETLKTMLQALLTNRFKLVVHNDTRSLSAYVLTAGKHLLLKQPEGTSASGCEDRPADHTPAMNGALSCHNMTMAAFAETLRTWPSNPMRSFLSTNPVADMTGLKGAFDFNLKWTGRGLLATAGSDGMTLFDAIDKQLGLKLELGKAPIPVVVVDSVNEKPTDNLPGVTKALPESAAEFEVAEIKLSTLDRPTPPKMQPGGRFSVTGTTLLGLIQHAWDIDEYDGMVSGPKFLDSDRYDIVAKLPADLATVGLNDYTFRLMLRTLLVSRFGMKTHTEEQPITVYALTAANPKLTKADPSNRTLCKYAGAAPGGLASALLRTNICQNATLGFFAANLHNFDPGYTNHPVVDMTGLAGAWDISVTFSGSRVFNGPAAAVTSADPNGAVSLFDALEKQLGLKLQLQKHPMPVLMIDHIEQKPTDN